MSVIHYHIHIHIYASGQRSFLMNVHPSLSRMYYNVTMYRQQGVAVYNIIFLPYMHPCRTSRTHPYMYKTSTLITYACRCSDKEQVCLYLLFQVKRRILMGTYALSAGYYDAVYKRAQQVLHPLFHSLFCSLIHSFSSFIHVVR